MYSESAHLYDLIYKNQGKDYKVEADHLHKVAQHHQKSQGNMLLDVACGTGLHLKFLGEYYQVEGIDLNEEMLNIARKNHPSITFYNGDMRNFSLANRYDVITCLFSAIGYMQDTEQLSQAVGNMEGHLKPGGVMLIEPWFSPDVWQVGKIHTVHVALPDLEIVRMNRSERRGNISFFTFHFLVGTPEKMEHFTEYHELTLFTHEQYLDAFQANGLAVTHEPEGLRGRGLLIGRKAL